MNDFRQLPASDAVWHAAVCRAKARYPTKRVARLYAKGAGRRFGKALVPYVCRVCERWHLRSTR